MKKSFKILASLNLVVFILLTPSVWAQYPQTDAGHIQSEEKFAQSHFETMGKLDPIKIKNFRARLEKEKTTLMNNAYETKLIEKIELEVDDHKSSLKSAKKELDEKKSKIAQVYDKFLLVKIDELNNCAQEQRPITECRKIIYEFIKGYMPFFVPDVPRTYLPQDMAAGFIFKSMFGFKFDRSSSTVEASNLVIENENLALTQSCLGEAAQTGQVLKQVQIQKLKQCGVDISIYNPFDESLWRKPVESYAKDMHNEWFPKEDEPVYFKQVKFSAAGSPKIEGEFTRDGKDMEVKVKMGLETHADTVSSLLGKLVGFYQDTSQLRRNFKVYLKDDMNLETFRVQFARKYNGMNKELNTFIQAYGKDKNGNYIIFKDVQLSVNDPDTVRVGPYDPASWNLQNLREHRSQVLWFGFLNLLDTKAGNHTMNYVPTKEGLVPRYSFQDVGYSLQFQYQLNWKNLLFNAKNPLAWGVNTFNDTFLDWDDKKVHVQWGEVVIMRGKFQSTTYNDVKWMARKIAKLTREEIEFAVQTANYPQEVADLYILKLLSRRNEVVRAFNLEKEFPIYSIPDLSTYSPNEKVKNGRVVVSHFDGYSSYELPRVALIPLILQTAISQINLVHLSEQFKLKLSSASLADVEVQAGQPVDFQGFNLLPGININLSRAVDHNRQYSSQGSSSQGFYIKDKFSIEIGVKSQLFGNISQMFPAELVLKGKVQVWKREYELIHFANSWKEAYTAPFKLFQFLPNFKSCLVECIQRGEVFKVLDGYGFDVAGKVPVLSVSGLPLNIGASYDWKHSHAVYFSRDIFNQFSIYRADNNSSVPGLTLDADIIFLKISPLEFSQTFYKLKHNSSLYRFTTLSEQNPEISIDQKFNAQLDQDLLSRYFEYGDSDLLVRSKKDLEIRGDARGKVTKFNFLNFFHFLSKSGSSEVSVRTSQQETKKFKRYTSETASTMGFNKKLLVIDANFTNLKKDSLSISIESEENTPDHTVAYVEFWDYSRSLKYDKLMDKINEMNRLFSINSTTPFYRDFILPDKMEVSKYKKVYFYNRIYINGNTLWNKIQTLNEKTLEGLYLKEYTSHFIQEDWDDLVTNFKAFQRTQPGEKNYLKNYAQFLKSMKLSDNGLGLLQKLVDDKTLFVMGEIYGIYPSFSNVQQSTQVAGTRFAGHSWGQYEIPPLRAFLHKYAIKHESIYIDGGVNFGEFFGTMPKGQVPYY